MGAGEGASGGKVGRFDRTWPNLILVLKGFRLGLADTDSLALLTMLYIDYRATVLG